MWSDHESEIDYVNFLETSELISELVANPSLQPVSIGVFGGWGSGKSTLIKLSKETLQKDDSYIIVDFDAWLFQDYDDARAALLEAVSSKLLEEAKDNVEIADKAKSLLARVDKLRALGLLIEGGTTLITGIPAFGAISRGVHSAGHVLAGEGDESDIVAIKKGVGDIKEKTSKIIKDEKNYTPPQEIIAFREEFAALLNDLNKTLVVYVDNLDRCLPRNAILTLEAIRLILFMPNTAFVIAADEDMIRLAVSEHYKTSQGRLINDYLDKLIQVPIQVPRLGIAEVTSYTFLLLSMMSKISDEIKSDLPFILRESLKDLWKDPLVSDDDILFKLQVAHILDDDAKVEIKNSYNLAFRLAPMLTQSTRVSGNPRIIKRMLNTIWIRNSIAEKRQMPIDETVIAKIALFERCAGNDAAGELYRLINESENGKPVKIKELEDSQEIKQDNLPTNWKDLDFIANWIKLEPLLANVDLRAAAYLAKESLPLRLSKEGLSPNAETAIKTLLKVKKLSSPTIGPIITSLSGEEHILVMEGIIEELRKVTSWSSAPDGLVGAIAIAKKSNEAGKTLKLFINKLNNGKLMPWLNIMIKDEDWWSGDN